jgi:hypothetical protein
MSYVATRGRHYRSGVFVDDPHAGDAEPRLLDRIDALRILRADSEDEKGRLLEQLGGRSRVDQDIVRQLAKPKPLWLPDQFDEAHRMAMKSLEVLDRNGVRAVPMPNLLGPLKPLVGFVVQLVTRWIVRGYQNNLAGSIRRLYERREAQSIWGSPAHVLLRRARIHATQVEHGLRSNPIGVPGFLLGGAALSGLFSLIAQGVTAAVQSSMGRIVVGVLTVVLLSGLSWVALFAAGVARRRISLSTDQPMRALWDVIGAAGEPPRDHSYKFALIAIILLLLAVLAVPIVVSAVI